MRALSTLAHLYNVSIPSFIWDGLHNFPGLCHLPFQFDSEFDAAEKWLF